MTGAIFQELVMGALTSIPLCQRARAEEDTNNNLPAEEDRNIPQVASPAICK